MSTLALAGTAYREEIAIALEDGWRFASLHATAADGVLAVRTVLSSPAGELRSETVDASGGAPLLFVCHG